MPAFLKKYVLTAAAGGTGGTFKFLFQDTLDKYTGITTDTGVGDPASTDLLLPQTQVGSLAASGYVDRIKISYTKSDKRYSKLILCAKDKTQAFLTKFDGTATYDGGTNAKARVIGRRLRRSI